ncbi:MAG: hypothetical protein QOG62_2263 [Thermoleophilaceae bacterium]|jgi:hypothetical protein|nr:hypothetical protein [Thermoleophilaceae bacterium]
MRTCPILLAAVVALLAPAAADAATTIGQADPVGTLPANCNRPAPGDEAMRSAPYIVPAGGGVITEWRYKANGGTPTVTPRVYHATSTQLMPIAETPGTVMTANTINRIPARIPVAGGEYIGFAFFGVGFCQVSTTDPNDDWMDTGATTPAAPLGGSVPFAISPGNHRLTIEATLEPDADKDGFGDETQDECPADPAKHDCTPPAAPSIDKHPKKKTGSAKATFGFSGEPGATFACQLDKQAFKACGATRKLKKLKERKHTFRVHAIDPAGNVGPDAVTRWRVTG